MAVLLIYNKTHWMELPSKLNPNLTGYERNHLVIDTNSKLSTAQKITSKERLTEKYSGRYVKGDIVEVRESGQLRGKLEENAFIFLDVPDLDSKIAKEYSGHKGIYGSGFNVDLIGLIPDKNKNITLNKSDFNTRLTEKEWQLSEIQ